MPQTARVNSQTGKLALAKKRGDSARDGKYQPLKKQGRHENGLNQNHLPLNEALTSRSDSRSKTPNNGRFEIQRGLPQLNQKGTECMTQ